MYIVIPWDDFEEIKKFKTLGEATEYAVDKFGIRFTIIKMKKESEVTKIV